MGRLRSLHIVLSSASFFDSIVCYQIGSKDGNQFSATEIEMVRKTRQRKRRMQKTRKQRGGISKKLLEASNLLQDLPESLHSNTSNSNIADLLSVKDFMKKEKIMELMSHLEVLVTKEGPISLESETHPVSDASNAVWKDVGELAKFLLMKDDILERWCMEVLWRYIRGTEIREFFNKSDAVYVRIFETLLRRDLNIQQYAAQYGRFELLEWYSEKNMLNRNDININKAALGGHLDIVQWLRNKGGTCYNVAEYAALGGHLHILQWVKATQCFYNNRPVTKNAAKGGHLEVLQWARANDCPWDEWTCTEAAKGGHLDVLKWARANGCPWDEYTCAYAAEGGHFDVLKWARANGCPWDKWTCHKAAEGGHLDVLKWARANGCPWDEWTCHKAAEGGHLEVLQWARINGCPWGVLTCSYAAKEGHLEVLQWVVEHGCPYDKEDLLYVSRKNNIKEYILSLP